SAERDTLVGIAVQGNIVNNSTFSLYPVEIDYNTIKNNIVNLDGNLYAYGITLQYFALHNTIMNNTITADSSTKFYVCGIQLSYLVRYNQIYNNKINLTALNFTYGINTQGIPGYNGYNDFYKNSINLSSIYTRGIESYIGYYDKIRYNVILVDGDYSNGIGLGGIVGNNITYNVINSTGTIFTVNTSTVDEIPFLTDGIYVNSARYYDQNGDVQTSLAGYNNIKFNYILTNGSYAIDLHAYFNNITNNYINSSSRYGNNAVNMNGNGSNTCNYNRAYINPYFLNNRLLLKSNKLQSTMLKSSGLDDNGVTTHVITNDNWNTFLSSEGLSSLVSDNDILDLQGEIIIDKDILIDKPVNITSTTNNGKISSSANVFEINNNGSHSNLTNICLYNTQLILNGADYINIDHINRTVENCGVGWGKGATSIREGCDYINITNSIFYIYNNGGSSNLVLCGAGFVNIDNNTIHSESGPEGLSGVGNVVYLNPYNVDNATNQFINITNNNITGPTNPAAICWLVALNVGHDVLLKGNSLTYTGEGVVKGVPNCRIEDNNFNNVTMIRGGSFTGAEIINNTGIHGFDVTGAKVVSGNEINGDYFLCWAQKDAVITNNVINVSNDTCNIINCGKFVFENNTYDSMGSLNIVGSHGSIIQNNTITTTADYSITLTNSSANTIRNNILTASELHGDYSVIGPGDYIENNTPTDITEYSVEDMDGLIFVLEGIEYYGDCETDEAVIYLEDGFEYDAGYIDEAFGGFNLNAPNKKVTIDGSRLNNSGHDMSLTKSMVDSVSEGSTLILKNLKMTIQVDSLTHASISGSHVEGNLTYENCFIQIQNPDMQPMGYEPSEAFINNVGTGYVSIKACTIRFNNVMNYQTVNYYKSLTSGNNVYIVNSIILGNNVNIYDADNPDTLQIRHNYIDSYDKTKYPQVQDEIVIMVNGIVSKNLIQVNGNEKVVIKLVAESKNTYDNPTHAIGYEDGLLLGSTNEEVMNTTGLILNNNNNTIILDENPVDQTVTLYAYVIYEKASTMLLPGMNPFTEKKLMDIVQYTATEKTNININLSTLTPAADNNINILITDENGNLLQTNELINVSVNGEETTYYFIKGNLSIPYKIMSSEGLTISAVYGGSNQYSRSNATVVFIGTNMTMVAQAETQVNSPIPVTIILTSDDNLLTGQEVTISTANGDETIELTNGFIIYQYTPTSVGEETIKVTLNSNGSYIASYANTTITVTEDKDTIIEELNNTVQEQNN
ncbi:right-handed parallel beta-helix repeat-containing protein, partial [Methanosphaera sp.]|uniref:right-handed parallel beta-helix repeat-containing protein n=1 Tax=Methanosphaera sp. TaxID=2666342 RepID=UPI002E76E76C